VDVTLVTYQRGGGESNLSRAARIAGGPVIDIPERKRWDPSIIPALRRVVTDFKPDILESRNVKSHFLIRLAGMHLRFPCIPWGHGYASKDRLDRMYTRLDRWSLHGAFRVMTVCGPIAAGMENLGIPKQKISVLHNFVKPYVAAGAERVARLK